MASVGSLTPVWHPMQVATAGRFASGAVSTREWQ